MQAQLGTFYAGSYLIHTLTLQQGLYYTPVLPEKSRAQQE
jgi:hypothetical protein